MRKKLISVFLIAAMAASMMMGCGNNSEEQSENPQQIETSDNEDEQSNDAKLSEKEQLTGTITWAQHRTDLETEINALVEAFNEVYPNVTVNVETVADYLNTMAVRVAGGEIPDVMMLEPSIVPAEKWADYFCPLNDSKMYGKMLFEDYFSYDGNVYALSETAGYRCFMYNKALWKQAGITEIPTTWAEFEACLEKLSALDGVIPFTTQYKTGWCMRSWIDHYATSVLGADWKATWVDTKDPLSNEVVQKTLDNFKSIVDQGYCDPDLMSSDWDLQAADFAAGTIATYLSGNYAYATMTALGMNPDDIGFFAFPNSDMTADGKCTVMAVHDQGFAISKETENYDAALAFVEFCAENYASYTNQITAVMGVECNNAPINEMLATDPVIVSETRPNNTFTEINNIAGITIANIVQEYIVSGEPSKVIEKYNAMWNAALEEYGK